LFCFDEPALLEVSPVLVVTKKIHSLSENHPTLNRVGELLIQRIHKQQQQTAENQIGTMAIFDLKMDKE